MVHECNMRDVSSAPSMRDDEVGGLIIGILVIEMESRK